MRSGGNRHTETDSPSELTTIIDNIGIPYSGLNLAYSTSAPIGPGDADIQVELVAEAPADGGVRERASFQAGPRFSGS